MTPQSRPPRLARWLAHALLRGDAREVIIGDLDQDFSDRIVDGMSSADARRRYWRHMFQSIASVHDERKRAFMTASITKIWQGLSLDIRSILRALQRSPGYAIIAVLSLAIGIGANTAIVSVVRQVMLRPLPIERPDELRLVYWQPPAKEQYSTQNLNSTGYTSPEGIRYRSNYTYPEFTAMAAAVGDAVPFAGYNVLQQLVVTAPGHEPISKGGLIVTGHFFDVVRPTIARGRGITPNDDEAGAPLVAVISNQLWANYLGSDPKVIGSTLSLGGVPATIIGVTGEGYRGLSSTGYGVDADVTVAMAAQITVVPQWAEDGTSLFAQVEQHWIRAAARVRVDQEAVIGNKLTAAFRGAATGSGLTPSQIAASAPALLSAPRGVDSFRSSTLAPLRLLTGVVAVVLLIACTNVAGLMLARGVSRQRELAVRRALGASRLRVIRELLVESVLLSLAGGIAGVGLALLAAPTLEAMLTSSLGTTDVTVALDWPTLMMTGGIAVSTGILAGLIPALRLSGRDGVSINDRGLVGAPRMRIGRVLLAIQIAVSLPLLAGAGLLLRTLHNLGRIEIGFNAKQLVLFETDPTLNGRVPGRAAIAYPALLDRLEKIPGVTAATYLENPLIAGWESDSTVTAPDGSRVSLMINRVGPHYFEALSVKLLAGRSIEARDRKDAPLVALLNESAARTFFGNTQPVGQSLKVGPRLFEIVGLFADTRYDSLKKSVAPTMLQSYLQNTLFGHTIAVRTSLTPESFRAQLTSAIHDVDPSLPFSKFRTQQSQIDESIGREHTFTNLLTLFGGFALLLACIGLNGVTSYAVTRRTSEIGVRLALGAQRGQVLWMILRQVLTLALIGLAVGVPMAMATTVALRPYLYELTSSDPFTIASAALAMIAVSALAGWLPARRAARMEALTALRTD